MTATAKTPDVQHPEKPDDINFMNQELMECPYHAYRLLRDEAPVWKDQTTGFYVVTRYPDVRKVLMSPKLFVSARNKDDEQVNSERARRSAELFARKGWSPQPTLALRDDPDHANLRSLFDHVFRAGRIKQLDPYVRDLAYRLMDEMTQKGQCEFLADFSVPFPLIVIGNQVGVPESDVWMIKNWVQAFCMRTGLMEKSDSRFLEHVEKEIEAQHYFQPHFERLRKNPDGSLLSDLVNGEIPGWGRTLDDAELHSEMMADTFVGGSETSTNALGAGIIMLARNPEVWQQLRADPEKYLKTFIEEVLRLESPVQTRVRKAAEDTELSGVPIPKGAFIDVRFAAANRDERQFECPDDIRLDRRNAASHMAFGSGVHHCLGAPLARREMYWGFKAFLDHVESFELDEERNDYSHVPNFWLRALNPIHIKVTRKTTPGQPGGSSE